MQTALDCGCGVGGPMRTIAATSGGNVTGITINAYQVKRANYHNEKVGLAKQCKVVQGNFLEMPFEPSSFDGAYAIEATCHAAKVGSPPPIPLRASFTSFSLASLAPSLLGPPLNRVTSLLRADTRRQGGPVSSSALASILRGRDMSSCARADAAGQGQT
jgi:hypothetical protein